MKRTRQTGLTHRTKTLWLLLNSLLIAFFCMPLVAQTPEPEAGKATLNQTYIVFPSGGGFKESETETPTGETITALQSTKSLFLSDGTNVDLIMQTAKESTGGETLAFGSPQWRAFLDSFVGMIMPMAYMPDRLTSGWIPCDGRQLSQATYGTLFAAIGHSYARSSTEADSSITFRVPDLRQKYIYSLPRTITVSDTGGYKEVSPTLFDPHKYLENWPRNDDGVLLDDATNVLFTFGPEKEVTGVEDVNGGGTVKSLTFNDSIKLDVEVRPPNHTHLLENSSVVPLELRKVSATNNDHTHTSAVAYNKGPDGAGAYPRLKFTLQGNEDPMSGSSDEDSSRIEADIDARIYGPGTNKQPLHAGVWKNGTGYSSETTTAHTHKLAAAQYTSLNDGEDDSATPRPPNAFTAFNSSTGIAYPNIDLDERDISKEYNASNATLLNEARPSTAVVMFCIFAGQINKPPPGYDLKVFPADRVSTP